MEDNKFVQEFKEKRIWLNWRLEKTKDDKPTKIPYTKDGQHASTTDPNTWNTFNPVFQALPKFTGIGIVFENQEKILGVDFDHCFIDEKIQDKKIETFLKEANSYCEFSPSGTGFHILFKSNQKIDLISKKNGKMEVYESGRYFTFTGNEHPIYSKKIRTITDKELFSLLSIVGYPWGAKIPIKLPPIKTLYHFSSDKELLEKVFASKNGAQIKKLWNGDLTKHNNDHSSADFSLCLHLSFWTGKDFDKIRSLWLSSPLGQREKTLNRKDYQDRTISRAIEWTIETYSPPLAPIKTSVDFITEKKNKIPIIILENICRIIKNDEKLKGKFRLNDYSHMTETNWDTSSWVNLYDACILQTQRYISEKYEHFRKVSKQMTTDAILAVAYENKVNPPKDYFLSLIWDGTPRLNSWLHHLYGTPDDELHQAIGSNWLKGLVKRVMKPGCIYDEVLALESPQGWRKSTSIRELGKPWHVETTHSMDDKDFFMVLAQNIIVEFSEGDIFDRASVKRIKAVVTKTEDQFRPPYERGLITFKRSCVFAVTTNKLELKDDTGNRRWLPVSLEKQADIEWLKENREQLFAEAFYRVIVKGETTYEYPKEPLEELQESRREWSDYDEKLLLWFVSLPEEKKEEGISLHEACNAILKDVRIGKLEEIQVASILRRMLHLENRNKKINGAVLKRWFLTDKTRKIISKIKIDDNIF